MKKLKNIMATTATALLVIASSAMGQTPQQSAWDSLPENVVFAARLPDGKAFTEAFRSRTRLGALLLDSQRIEKFMDMVRAEAGNDWDKMVADLEKYGLEPGDWHQMYNGETGIAVSLIAKAGQKEPTPIAVLWANPGDELAGRLKVALDRALADEDNADLPKRFDVDVAGMKVMHLVAPREEMQFNMDQEPMELPDNFAELSDEEREALFAEREAMISRTTYTQAMLAFMGGRVMMVTGGKGGFDTVEAAMASEEATEIAAMTARMITSQTDGKPGAFSARVMATPGMGNAKPAGLAGVELMIDGQRAYELAKVAAPADAMKTLEALGLSGVRPGAMWMSLDENVMRLGGFMGVPEPRPGLFQLLNQTPIGPEPPAWAPAGALNFTQISFDLGEAYKVIKQVVIAVAGEQATGQFMQVEGQAQQMFQTDVPTLLSSLGHSHHIVEYPPTPAAEGQDQSLGNQRMAVVWKLKDEQIWQRVFGMLGAMAAGMGPDQVQAVQEQGFSGWRAAPQGAPTEFGVFMGNGYLMLSIGKDVSSQVMSSLRTPPAESIARSPRYQRLATLLNARPAVSMNVLDGDAYVDVISTMMQMAMNQSPDGEKLRDIMPTADELDGTLGVSGGQVSVGSQGVSFQSVVELPAGE